MTSREINVTINEMKLPTTDDVQTAAQKFGKDKGRYGLLLAFVGLSYYIFKCMSPEKTPSGAKFLDHLNNYGLFLIVILVFILILFVLVQITKNVELVDPDIIAMPDRDEFEKFLEACKNSARVLFINVQINQFQWFDPWAQVHLALQDSANRHIQLTKYLNYIKENENKKIIIDDSIPIVDPSFLTPFHRVLLTAEPVDVVTKQFKNQDGNYLLPLMDIHSCLGLPLAIMCIEKFLELLKNNSDFSANYRYMSHLGFSHETIREVPNMEEHIDAKLIKKDLINMRIERGKSLPYSIDCALLYKSFEGKNPEVWQAYTDSKGVLHYYKIESGIRSKMISYFPKTPKDYSPMVIKNALTEFGGKIFNEIFEAHDIDSKFFDDREVKCNPLIKPLRQFKRDTSFSEIKLLTPKDPYNLFGLKRKGTK